jgi:hypothetical protein
MKEPLYVLLCGWNELATHVLVLAIKNSWNSVEVLLQRQISRCGRTIAVNLHFKSALEIKNRPWSQ